MKKLIIFLLFSTVCFGQINHRVKRDETLFGISNHYNITIEELKSFNPFLDKGLKVGQELKIPTFVRPVVALDSVGAKVIALELDDCEYTKKELQLEKKISEKTEIQSKTKDALVDIMQEERKVVNTIAENNSTLLLNCEEQKKELNKLLKKEQVKNIANKIIYFTAGVAVGYFIIR